MRTDLNIKDYLKFKKNIITIENINIEEILL